MLDGFSNHQSHDCLLNRLFRRRSKKTSKLRVTGLCAGNSPGTGEFSAQMASNAEMCPFDDVIMCYWGYGSRLVIQSVAFTGYERDSSFWMSIILLYLLSQNPYRIVLSTILRWFLHIDALHQAFACSLLVLCVAAPRHWKRPSWRPECSHAFKSRV